MRTWESTSLTCGGSRLRAGCGGPEADGPLGAFAGTLAAAGGRERGSRGLATPFSSRATPVMDQPGPNRTRPVSSQIHIFAYGSNLDPTRIRTRIPSTRVVGRSWLEEHDLRFHVRGTLDGTAKADAFYTGEATHRVLGMIYTIRRVDLPTLDRIEGGYSRVLHRLPLDVGGGPTREGAVERLRERPGGRMVSAWSYHGRPDTIAEGLRPYDWYLDHVIRGARFHAFPGDYLQRLEDISSISRTP